MPALLELNPLKSTDIIFFIVLAAIVVLCVIVYFLIPVFNKKQYREQRENLKKREVAFKSNIQRTDGTTSVGGQTAEETEGEARDASGAPSDPSQNEEK